MNTPKNDFRPGLGFYGVWALFGVLGTMFQEQLGRDLPWWSKTATVILCSLLLTLLLFVPPMVVNRVFLLGQRNKVLLGWSAFVFCAGILVCVLLAGHGHETTARFLKWIFLFVSIYLLKKSMSCPKV
jgi:hypothetical protein